jgi:hypothetical protein
LKIKTFVIDDDQELTNSSEKFTSIQLLIQKIGPYIENLALSIIYDSELRRNLFNIIIDSCEKIKFLHLDYVDIVNVPQLYKMIVNANNYLKYLTLEIDYYSDNVDRLKISSMILKDLSKSLPHSLYYLNLHLIINPDDLQIALENCKQADLKKLLIRNDYNENYEVATFKVIKDFAKEKNLESLSYNIESSLNSNGVDVHHSHNKSLGKLAEEIQSFTKMRRYDDLVIKISEMDGTLITND